MEQVAYTHDYREQTAEWNDWQVGPFSRLSIGDSDSGQTVGDTGWYRKTFHLPGNSVEEVLRQKLFRLRFEGVYNQAEVWANGKKAAMNVFGFMPFVVDLNTFVNYYLPFLYVSSSVYKPFSTCELCSANESLGRAVPSLPRALPASSP